MLIFSPLHQIIEPPSASAGISSCDLRVRSSKARPQIGHGTHEVSPAMENHIHTCAQSTHHVCMHTHTHTETHAYTLTDIIHTYYIHAHRYTLLHTYTYMQTDIHIQIHTCMYMYTNVHIYMHTYAHTYTLYIHAHRNAHSCT